MEPPDVEADSYDDSEDHTSQTEDLEPVQDGQPVLLGRTGRSKGHQDELPDKPDKIADPAWAAISLAQLEDLRTRARAKLGDLYRSATMYDVNREIIQPMCNLHGKSYAHAVNGKLLLKLNVFISHAWLENFDEFVEAVLSAFSAWPVKPNIWICATALLQSTDPNVVAMQVGLSSDPCNAPFTKALCKANKLLIVRNRACDIYDRIWCCWELYCAYTHGLVTEPGSLMVVGPRSSVSEGDKVVDVAVASASDLNDKRKILSYITATPERYEAINKTLMQVKRFGEEVSNSQPDP
eukprot:TRINITY_DN11297_c0_g1_i1.p1 TRINITY_DN11297_c0_g1~~TRINITY_DN11297_c0_g1_i1.p1  ORF type:complete len:295 (-),score=46.48 TRINITY_DN11297_c0_g1_i1:64-948(-)